MLNTLQKIKNNSNLLKEYGSPLYVYDYDVINMRCHEMKRFKEELESKLNGIKVNMHYSPKANNNPAILKIVKEAGLNIDCMSPLELSINKKVGFSNSQILYVCNNIDQEEMKLVHNADILICLDSISQVEMWGELFPNTDIMVRINPGVKGIGHNQKVITSGRLTKFGISEENLYELFDVTKKYNLNIVGTHQHLGSLFLNDKIDDYIAGVKAGLDIIKKYFKNVQIVDLGGGFGVPYKRPEQSLDLLTVAHKLEEILISFSKENPSVQEFKFEPGRFIPCEAGILMGTVNAIKHENGIYWIGTDLGMNELVRPSMYDSYHEVTLLENRNTEEVTANISGNVCESGDIIAKDRVLNLPLINDIILIHNAGAYGYSMASNYTGRPRPAEIMLYDDQVKLIRKRDTIEYMESNIIWN